MGEEVKCTFSRGSASWSLSGPGTLSSGGPSESVSYTAPDTAGSATITAKGGGCSDTITFTIVAPDSVHMVRNSGVEHNQGFPDVGMKTSIYFGPDDVSFYNIQYHEVNCTPTVKGVYSCLGNCGHDPNPTTLSASTTVVGGKGTQMNAVDHVYSGHCGKTSFFTNSGSEEYDIPYEYKVGSGSFHNFATVVHLATCLSSGSLTIQKAGAQGDTTIDSATVTI